MAEKSNDTAGTLVIIAGLFLVAFFCSDGFLGVLLAAGGAAFSALLRKRVSPRMKKLMVAFMALGLAIFVLSIVRCVQTVISTGDWTAAFYINERAYNRRYGIDPLI